MFECWGVINTVACHDAEALTAMKSFHHANFGSRGTSCQHEWETIEGINLGFRELVKFSTLHYEGISVGRRQVKLSDETNFLGNRGGCVDMVTSQHMNAYSGLDTGRDSTCSFNAGWVVESHKAEELEIILCPLPATELRCR